MMVVEKRGTGRKAKGNGPETFCSGEVLEEYTQMSISERNEI